VSSIKANIVPKPESPGYRMRARIYRLTLKQMKTGTVYQAKPPMKPKTHPMILKMTTAKRLIRAIVEVLSSFV
jgi:hypothetical protein